MNELHQAEGRVDYSDEPPLDPSSLLEPATEPYDPEPQRENVRLLLASALVSLVVLEVIGGFVALFAHTPIGDLKALLEIVFSPSVALAAGATGFYFGGQHS